MRGPRRRQSVGSGHLGLVNDGCRGGQSSTTGPWQDFKGFFQVRGDKDLHLPGGNLTEKLTVFSEEEECQPV